MTMEEGNFHACLKVAPKEGGEIANLKAKIFCNTRVLHAMYERPFKKSNKKSETSLANYGENKIFPKIKHLLMRIFKKQTPHIMVLRNHYVIWYFLLAKRFFKFTSWMENTALR